MKYSIQQIIDALPRSPQALAQTVDQLLYGEKQQLVSKAAVTFAANQEVLEQAVSLGISFIISHEGLYYSHHQAYPATGSSELYIKREQYIKQHKLAIYRYHDHCHRHVPDLLTYGLVKHLKWDAYMEAEGLEATIVSIPPKPLHELIQYVKQQLELPYLRYVGSTDITCRKIALLVGFRGNASSVIPLIDKHQLDAVIIGEGMEWEAPEFIRDSNMLGRPCALLTIGHAESEQPGMQYIAELIQAACPQLDIHHLKAKPIYEIG